MNESICGHTSHGFVCTLPDGHNMGQADVPEAHHPAQVGADDPRKPECVERWPECESFLYDPRCCRFPKSCSAGSSAPQVGADDVAGLVEEARRLRERMDTPAGLELADFVVQVRDLLPRLAGALQEMRNNLTSYQLAETSMVQQLSDLTARAEEADGHLEEAQKELSRIEREISLARFAPLGDNHHNAAICPHCGNLLGKAKEVLRVLHDNAESLTPDDVRNIALGFLSLYQEEGK